MTSSPLFRLVRLSVLSNNFLGRCGQQFIEQCLGADGRFQRKRVVVKARSSCCEGNKRRREIEPKGSVPFIADLSPGCGFRESGIFLCAKKLSWHTPKPQSLQRHT